MRLVEVVVREDAHRVALVARVERHPDQSPFEVSFAYPATAASYVFDGADAFVPALLLPAMAAGEPLEIVPPVSPQLLRRIPQLLEIYSAWYPQVLRPIHVSATPRVAGDLAPGPNVAAFFACGVDAFYTLLKHVRRLRPEPRRLTHILFMRGIEVPLHEARSEQDAIRQVEEVARETGVELIVGETNLRSHFPLLWGMYCGAGLAATALSLSKGFSDVLIPSSLAYSELVPWGSHPFVDELWSNERTTVRDDGAEATRGEKIERIVAADPVAHRYLRVCTQNDGGGYNCGRCIKCIRTMVALHACGHLEHMHTFPKQLPSEVGRLMRADWPSYVEENLGLFERSGRDPALRALLEREVRRARRVGALRQLAEAWIRPSVLARLRDWRRRAQAS